MAPEELREGHIHAYRKFYSLPSIARRFPLTGSRDRLQWGIYNTFFRRGEVTGRDMRDAIAPPTAEPRHIPRPPIMPQKREWREAVADGIGQSEVA